MLLPIHAGQIARTDLMLGMCGHAQLADVLYTMGGAAHYRAARAYYAAAVDLSSGENVRALYGLCATAAQLSALNQGSSKVLGTPVHLPRACAQLRECLSTQACLAAIGLCLQPPIIRWERAGRCMRGCLQGKDAGGAEDLGVLAGQALLRRYARDAEDKVPLVKATLKAQGLLD